MMNVEVVNLVISLFDEETTIRWNRHCARWIINDVFSVLKQRKWTLDEFKEVVTTDNLRMLLFMCFEDKRFDELKLQALANDINGVAA